MKTEQVVSLTSHIERIRDLMQIIVSHEQLQKMKDQKIEKLEKELKDLKGDLKC